MKRQGLLSATGILLLGLVMLMTLHEWDSTLPGQDNAVMMAPAIIADDVTAVGTGVAWPRAAIEYIARYPEATHRDKP